MLTIIFLLSSCGIINNFKDVNPPGLDFADNNLNTFIRIEDEPSLQNSYQNSKMLSFYVSNSSTHTIVFPGDYAIKLFAWDKNEWVTVENYFDYPTTKAYLLPEPEFPPGMVINLAPHIADIKSRTRLRVYIFGASKDNPNLMYGAFIDVMIFP
jgi:hypothetical protein